MENQRLFLVIGLVFVLFLIYQAWVDEHRAITAPPPVAIEGQPADDGSVPQIAPPPSSETDGGGVPTAGSTTAGSSGRVHVRTDVLDVEIDLQGGDIRRVALPTYPESVQRQDQPFVLMHDDGTGQFFAQSGLLAGEGMPAPNHFAAFTAEATEYRIEDGADTLVVPLTWTDPASGLTVTKRYTFTRDSFVIGLDQEVVNNGDAAWTGRQYRQLQRMPPTESNNAFGVYTYTGGVISSQEKNYEKISFDDMAEANLDREVQGGWVAMIQHYFLGAWVPSAQDAVNHFYTKSLTGERYVIGMTSAPRTAEPGGRAQFQAELYVGPKIQDRLEAVAPNLERTVDFGFLWIISHPLFIALKWIHSVIGNWGWSIVILTIGIKAVFFKLSETSYRSMARMRKMTPHIQRLRERYGDDRQRMNQEMMTLYRKEKINPLGGCLPIAVQIPVFIALYWMLLESVELRQAPWILWIDDLSQRDPFYVMPIIMGASMFIQQKLNPPPPDPIQAKVMQFLPVVFTVFFLWFPSGLVLYWIVNNVLSIAQQWVITKRIEAGEDTPPAKA